MPRQVRWWVFAALAAVLPVQSVDGVVLYESADRNITRPDDDQGGAGWDLQGNWGNYSGTPVGSRFFLTSKHVGGDASMLFNFRGQDYAIDTTFGGGLGYVQTDDLRLWKVTTDLPDWTWLYDGGNEAGMTVTVIGRGRSRGDEVVVNGELKGWKTNTTYDGLRSWGQNVVSGYASLSGGETFYFTFDANGIENECTLAVNDSSGAVFAEIDGRWALVGLNYAVTGLFSTVGGSDSGFRGAIFDAGGLYVGEKDKWTYYPNQSYDLPGAGYAMRLSQYSDWFGDYIPANELRMVPEPMSLALWLVSGVGLLCRRRLRRQAASGGQ